MVQTTTQMNTVIKPKLYTKPYTFFNAEELQLMFSHDYKL